MTVRLYVFIFLLSLASGLPAAMAAPARGPTGTSGEIQPVAAADAFSANSHQNQKTAPVPVSVVCGSDDRAAAAENVLALPAGVEPRSVCPPGMTLISIDYRVDAVSGEPAPEE